MCKRKEIIKKFPDNFLSVFPPFLFLPSTLRTNAFLVEGDAAKFATLDVVCWVEAL